MRCGDSSDQGQGVLYSLTQGTGNIQTNIPHTAWFGILTKAFSDLCVFRLQTLWQAFNVLLLNDLKETHLERTDHPFLSEGKAYASPSFFVSTDKYYKKKRRSSRYIRSRKRVAWLRDLD